MTKEKLGETMLLFLYFNWSLLWSSTLTSWSSLIYVGICNTKCYLVEDTCYGVEEMSHKLHWVFLFCSVIDHDASFISQASVSSEVSWLGNFSRRHSEVNRFINGYKQIRALLNIVVNVGGTSGCLFCIKQVR
ncbi:hypothetical protein KSF78_0000939 [Schistosoma japonicum]|nr:hypothetical protein KSF78_0000939 [Schistosoma japonicum]